MVKFGSFGFVQNENLFAGSKDLDGSKDVELTCPICLEIFDRPVTTQCGHTYCQSCLQECLCRPDPVCAMCRTDLQGNWAKATELEDLIHLSVAPCKGCTAKVRLTHMKSHTATCAKYQECIEEEIKATAQSRQAVIKPVPNRHTFTCPYCDFRNLDQDGLAEHCTSQHARDPHPVVCPICASMPWGDPEYRSGNFLRHLKTRHTFAYDTYVDYSADEEVMMREALERSLTQQ